jgi:molybdopterin-guanine dinucleotide biosynthesis protein A
MKPHNKHAKLDRPFPGNFGRQEWAIIGTPCGNIQQLASAVIRELGPCWKTAYIDADHQTNENELQEGVHLEYTDKIEFHRIDFRGALSPFQFRPLLNEQDLILVNGNHFTAEKQILVIDPKKADSVQRKMDRLTNVQLILYAEGVDQLHSFLQEQMPQLADLPAFSLNDTAAVTHFLEQQLKDALPPLYGLVLAGGKSQRMGRDKGLIEYHGLPQREYAYQLLEQVCEKTFLSVRPDQVDELPDALKPLPDTLLGLGPYGAMLSAFQAHPDKAWLVLACDLPLVDREALQFLIENRNSSKIATAFQSPVSDFPDPLLTIWEPKSYLVLLQFLAQGYSCPRKALINSDIELLQAPNPEWLRNVNTEEEFREIVEKWSR